MKIAECFSCTRIFYSHRLARWHWNIVSKYIRGGYHVFFKNCLLLLFIITFPEDLYNFLIFSRHLCSYIAYLLNYWSTPIITICCFSNSDCNNPLIVTHYYSNYLISRIESITLVYAYDLEHCAAWELLPSILKHRYYFTGGRYF